MNKNEYLNCLNNIAQHINLSHDTYKLILIIYEKIFSSSENVLVVKKIDDDLFSDEYAIGEEMQQEAINLGYDPYEFALFISVWHSKKMHEIYKNNSWDDTIYYNSLEDIEIFSQDCLMRYKKIGLDIDYYKYLTLVFKGSMIGLGSLRYISGKNSNGPLTFGKITINQNDRLIGLHIPPRANITKEKLIESYNKAFDFFKCKDYLYCICDSWLLYKKHREFLSENTNIVQFMNDFHIIKDIESNDTSELWRLFGKAININNLDNLPSDTTLQKAYIKHLKEFGVAGHAIGILIYNKEKGIL